MLHESIKVVARVGDVDPLNDGGAIYDHGDDRPTLVYLVSAGDEDEYGEPQTFHRFTADLLDIEDDAFGEHAWIQAEAVANSCGYSIQEYENLCRGTLLQKAHAIIDAAGYYGWENFDGYPEVMNRAEAEAWAESLDQRERDGQ